MERDWGGRVKRNKVIYSFREGKRKECGWEWENYSIHLKHLGKDFFLLLFIPLACGKVNKKEGGLGGREKEETRRKGGRREKGRRERNKCKERKWRGDAVSSCPLAAPPQNSSSGSWWKQRLREKLQSCCEWRSCEDLKSKQSHRAVKPGGAQGVQHHSKQMRKRSQRFPLLKM